MHLTNSWEPAREKERQFTGQGTNNTVSAAFDELDFEYATSVAEKAMRSMAEQPPRSDDSVTTPMISKELGRLNNG